MTELCPLDLEKFLFAVSVHFFPEVAHTAEMKFGAHVYHKNIYVKLCFGYGRAICDRVMPHGFRKIPIICFHFIISAKDGKINF